MDKIRQHQTSLLYWLDEEMLTLLLWHQRRTRTGAGECAACYPPFAIKIFILASTEHMGAEIDIATVSRERYEKRMFS